MKDERGVISQLKSENHKSEINLEALRGAAALIVVWSHATVFSDILNPGYHIEGWAASEPPARISVFLFFVLSGFVIGISNKQSLSGKAIGIYLKKRFLRIYPIYFLAMLFTLLIAKSYHPVVIAANFSFLQVAFADVIWENNPIWSLNYEVLYYLIFIPISFFRINYILTLVITLSVGLLNLWFFPSHPLLSSYSFGLSTWVIGLILAHLTQNSATEIVEYRVLVGVIMVLCSFRYFNVLDTVFLKITRILVGSKLEYTGERGYQAMVNFSDFSYLPYFILFILLFTNKKFRFKIIIKNILLILPSLTFIYLYKNSSQVEYDKFVQPGILYVLGMVLIYMPFSFLEKTCKYIIQIFIKIGSLSYGLYIIHMPLLILIGRLSWTGNSMLIYYLKLILLFTSALAISYILEIKIQPRIRSYFQPWLRPAL